MRGDKTAIEQLIIEPNWLGGGLPVELAKFDRKPFAQLCPCPAGHYIRWLWLDWQHPDATTIHADRDAAIEYIRLWVSGLDIVPLDENGNPEV